MLKSSMNDLDDIENSFFFSFFLGGETKNYKIIPNVKFVAEMRHLSDHLKNHYSIKGDSLDINMTSLSPLPYKSHQSRQK